MSSHPHRDQQASPNEDRLIAIIEGVEEEGANQKPKFKFTGNDDATQNDAAQRKVSRVTKVDTEESSDRRLNANRSRTRSRRRSRTGIGRSRASD